MNNKEAFEATLRHTVDLRKAGSAEEAEEHFYRTALESLRIRNIIPEVTNYREKGSACFALAVIGSMRTNFYEDELQEIQALHDAIRRMQSTDHPLLVPIHDELQALLADWEKKHETKKPVKRRKTNG